ncbi:MAG: hypothetical protein ACQESP_11430 [Candidatus Muiribacteriota bacterium]
MIKKNLLFFLNLFICFILLNGCATFKQKQSVLKNDKEKKIISDKRYKYARKIIKKIPDYKESPSYPDFKIKLSIKTKDFNHNIKTIREAKDISIKIQAYSLAANKFNAINKPEKAKRFINEAQKEIFLEAENQGNLSYQLSVFYNDILKSALLIDFPDFFEQKVFEYITISNKYKTDPYILKPVLVSMKKYFNSFSKNNSGYSETLLKFTEKTSLKLKPEKKDYEIKTKHKQYDIDVSRTFFKSPAREKGQVLVQLCEIYLTIGRTDKIPSIYEKILKIWNHSLNNPHLGKSTEIYFSKLVTILCKAGYYKKALNLAYSIPDVYPFYLIKQDYFSKYEYRYLTFKIKKYNQLGKLHRFRCLKNIAGQMFKTSGKEKTIQWVNKNFDDKDKKIEIISSLSDADGKEKKFPEKDLLSLYKKEKNNSLNSSMLKNLYLPLLTFYIENKNNKAEQILDELLVKINNTQNNEDKALFYTKTASVIDDFNLLQSRKLYKKGLNTAFELKSEDTIHKLMIIQRLIFKYSLNIDFIYLDEYISQAQKMIDNIKVSGNRDRQLEAKINAALYVSRFLKIINKYDKASVFTDIAVEYAELLSVQDLKNSYYMTLFTDYADNYDFKKAYEFFPKINITPKNKDYFIKKLTFLFVYRWES